MTWAFCFERLSPVRKVPQIFLTQNVRWNFVMRT